MLRKNDALSRVFLGMYLVWLFGCSLAPLLFIKLAIWAAIIFLVLWLGVLVLIIIAHVKKNKDKYEEFLLFWKISSAALTGLFLIGLVFEIVLSIEGQASTAAWIGLGISIACYAIAAPFLPKMIKKILAKEE